MEKSQLLMVNESSMRVERSVFILNAAAWNKLI